MRRVLALGFAVAMGAGVAHAGGDAAHGKLLFQQRCQACHSADDGVNRVGPTLFHVVGRPAASVAGFPYSTGLVEGAAHGLVWNEATLDDWLANPRLMIKGTKMTFAGVSNAADRADLIEFLKAAP